MPESPLPPSSAFENSEECLLQIESFLGEYEITQAIETLEQCIKHTPKLQDSNIYYFLRGKISHAQERYKEARHHFRTILKDPEWNARAHYHLGRVWLDAGRIELAAQEFLLVINQPEALLPYKVHAYSGLCVAYTGLGRSQSAEQAIEQAVDAGLISGQLLADEALRLEMAGSREAAKGELVRALEVDDKCENAFFQLSNLLYIDGEGEQALDILHYGIESCPQSIKLFSLSGEIYFSQKAYKDASLAYSQAIHFSPQGANADSLRLQLARSLYQNGEQNLAAQELENLLKEHPRSGFRRHAKERLQNLKNPGSDRKHIIYNFPRKLQNHEYCAPNTLANLFAFYGLESSQEEIGAEIFTQGTRWHDLVAFLKEQKDLETHIFLSDLEQLKVLLDHSIPLIVGEYSGLDGHCIALIGYDDTLGVVYAQDPLFFEPVEISYQHFMLSWLHTDKLVVLTAPQDIIANIKPSFHQEALLENWLQALELQSNEKVTQSFSLFEDLLATAPELQILRRSAVESAIMLQNWDQAKTLLDSLLDQGSSPFWALRYAGDIAFQRTELDLALHYYTQATRIFPNDPVLHYIRGEISLLQGNTQKGRAQLSKALEIEPTLIPPRVRLAQTYKKTNDFKKARYHSLGVLELEPENVEVKAILEELDKS